MSGTVLFALGAWSYALLDMHSWHVAGHGGRICAMDPDPVMIALGMAWLARVARGAECSVAIGLSIVSHLGKVYGPVAKRQGRIPRLSAGCRAEPGGVCVEPAPCRHGE